VTIVFHFFMEELDESISISGGALYKVHIHKESMLAALDNLELAEFKVDHPIRPLAERGPNDALEAILARSCNSPILGH
jgi:hypothetical protein